MTISDGVLPAIPFGKPGCVDDVTGRMGLTIEMWQKIGDPDLPVYWCTGDAFSSDEWAYVDGIDLHVDRLNADVWFEGGQCKTVPIGTVIYMARNHAEPLLPETLRDALNRGDGAYTDPAVALGVIKESESLLRAVDSSKGSFLDRKADALYNASAAIAGLIEREKAMREALVLAVEKADRIGGDMKFSDLIGPDAPNGECAWYRKAVAAIGVAA